MEHAWDYSIVWKETLNLLRGVLSEQEFRLWFFEVDYYDGSEETLRIRVPSSFVRDQIKQRYQRLIEDKFYELLGRKLLLDFVVEKRSLAQERPVSSSSPQREIPKERPPHPQLRRDYTFENFVIGENNAFAANAALAIAKNPGTAYNPCLIYGGVGLGKTHLLQSIGNSVYGEFQNLKVVYVTAEEFTNEFIASIQNKETHKFKTKYRNVDVLLIDDIHFFMNKTETQEELFHTFNALYDANKQMVFTCDRPVSELKNISHRLRSRFERGLNVDLQPPSFETRYAILKKKIEQKPIHIPDEVITFIAEHVTTNVRDLEAALTKLIAYAELVHRDITIDIAKSQLKDMFTTTKQTNITIDLIQKVVADYFGITQSDLRNKKRTRTVVFPRQIAMYIARELTEYSTTEIGEYFGGRDHTTVMYAIQKIESKMRTDPTLDTIIAQLIREVQEGTK
ncbi:Chromosomal replication initiator protein dnaA [Spirochaeta thermophila DSM 6578]|uniref:Chromosomal replication initiator protein DnaA n=1 Tax=Winmispira thermophila (strain ATCC 700085 / DSM 6578 / Z-1203) TaxID=869211 RepID=G0GAY6_WINT7|nr:chromosomal replication initiator protein DnaA [Spirochaeta thermophila]AEJ60288.1 Chromosomal replication initiator protein dnaA [Spirochaeta thermophila DSM 6578]